MIIETKFDLGQKVYKVLFIPTTLQIKCQTCDGKGQIFLHGEDFRCPKYCDNGFRKETAPPKWEVGGPFKIGKVGVQFFEKPDEHNTNEITYMFYQTGVGSGTLHQEKDIFPSIDTAAREAERRNKNV